MIISRRSTYWIWNRIESSSQESERRRTSKERRRNRDSSTELEKVSLDPSSPENSLRPPNLLHKSLVDNLSSSRIDLRRRRSNREIRKDRWIPSNGPERLHSSVPSPVRLLPPPSPLEKPPNRPLQHRLFRLNVPLFPPRKLPIDRLVRIDPPSPTNEMRRDSRPTRREGVSRLTFIPFFA